MYFIIKNKQKIYIAFHTCVLQAFANFAMFILCIQILQTSKKKKKNKQNPTQQQKGIMTELHHVLMGKEYYAVSFPKPFITNIGK